MTKESFHRCAICAHNATDLAGQFDCAKNNEFVTPAEAVMAVITQGRLCEKFEKKGYVSRCRCHIGGAAAGEDYSKAVGEIPLNPPLEKGESPSTSSRSARKP